MTKTAEYQHPNPVIDVLRRIEPFRTIRRLWRTSAWGRRYILAQRLRQSDAAQGALYGRTDELGDMFRSLRRSDPAYHPSRFWQLHSAMNVAQLDRDGIKNFKRTAALSYFTWMVAPSDPQFKLLLDNTPPDDWQRIERESLAFKSDEAKHYNLSEVQQMHVYQFTAMIWDYARRNDTSGILERLSEPALGNPFPVMREGKLISQDLANSVLEINSIREGFALADGATICELGAGYGRNAFVLLSEYACRYIVVDIPPALYICQHYLTSLFPQKKHFRFRDWGRYEDVRDEIEGSDIVFLLPHQAAMLPDKCVDLTINISSLHEMPLPQIAMYVRMIERLTHGALYSKQWARWHNELDDVIIEQKDYPVPSSWKEVYLRTPQVQDRFFEALYHCSESGK